jgi:hypothetical protein
MPKYISTHEDIYSTKPCAVCGQDVIDESSDTCCRLCEQQWQMFKEDYEQMMMEDLMKGEQNYGYR